jgi:phosphoribosyl-dephospho-CoA transferase
MMDLHRHTLVWLTKSPQPELERDVVESDHWHRQGRPFVVCRQQGDPDRLSLGFCLVAKQRDSKPRRFAVQTLRENILRVENPPSLFEVVHSNAIAAPTTLRKLSQEVVSAGLDVHVFGSWMWQMLTRDPYASASSDLDILIKVGTKAEASRAITFLKQEASELPFSIDGELSIPRLGEVHWREYCSDAPSLLFKSLTSVQMISRGDIWR